MATLRTRDRGDSTTLVRVSPVWAGARAFRLYAWADDAGQAVLELTAPALATAVHWARKFARRYRRVDLWLDEGASSACVASWDGGQLRPRPPLPRSLPASVRHYAREVCAAIAPRVK